ncbi:MAG: hypothetical protein MUD00_02525 [Candidatus Pacebacteria bacterium]|jgi:hypothetical protein|nr:hypothetical protein [Candidatus Paceibacterota bacterium]
MESERNQIKLFSLERGDGDTNPETTLRVVKSLEETKREIATLYGILPGSDLYKKQLREIGGLWYIENEPIKEWKERIDALYAPDPHDEYRRGQY